MGISLEKFQISLEKSLWGGYEMGIFLEKSLWNGLKGLRNGNFPEKIHLEGSEMEIFLEKTQIFLEKFQFSWKNPNFLGKIPL